MWDSEPRAGKSSEKRVKSHEMSQISKKKDFQQGLWVLEVIYHLGAGAVKIMINLLRCSAQMHVAGSNHEMEEIGIF